jgi:hypothetical protein
MLSNYEVPKVVAEWWAPKPDFKFDGIKTVINTASINGVEDTKNLDSFSIATLVRVIKFPGNDMTIMGHSGCGCYALRVNK